MRFATVTTLIAVLACLGAGAAGAAERPMVHGIVPPAWVERQGRIIALRPETLLLDGDEVRTGPGGRAELDLPDGSTIRLGTDTRLAMPSSRMKRVATDDVFDSALHLLKGAFRFTTQLAGKAMKRDVRLRVGTVTIGIRGTDLMIVAGADGDHIMLVEGRIELSGAGMAAPMMMEEKMDLMLFSKDGLMSHPAMEREALMGEMHSMEAMVVMPSGHGMLMMGMAPRYDVVVMSFRDPARAARVASALEQDGWPAAVEEGEAFGATWNRVAVGGFPSKAEAVGFAARIEGQHGITGAWLKRH